MLIQFSVQNFGSIKDKQTLSFEADKSTHLEDYYVIRVGGLRLLKLGLIYGANASGKTTILKALDFLKKLVSQPEDKKTNELQVIPFLFDAETPHQNTFFNISFIQNNIRYDYEVELNKQAIVREQLISYNPKKALVFERNTDLDKQLTHIKLGGKVKKDKIAEKTLEANTLWNNTVFGGFLKTNLDFQELKDVTDWYGKYLGLVTSSINMSNITTGLINLKGSNSVVNMLTKADFNISNIKLEEKIPISNEIWELVQKKEDFSKENPPLLEKAEKTQIIFEHKVNNQTYQLPIEQESQGTVRYYGFSSFLWLLITGQILLCIDELESSLHPDLYNHFLLTFLVNAKKSQLIATTHNREIFNNKDILRNDAIWFTNKNSHSATELYSLADFDTSVVRDTTNIYNAYKAGKLGAVPNLGDYYIDIPQHENK